MIAARTTSSSGGVPSVHMRRLLRARLRTVQGRAPSGPSGGTSARDRVLQDIENLVLAVKDPELRLAELVQRNQGRVVGHRPGITGCLSAVGADLKRDHDRELWQVQDREQKRPRRLVEAHDVACE